MAMVCHWRCDGLRRQLRIGFHQSICGVCMVVVGSQLEILWIPITNFIISKLWSDR